MTKVTSITLSISAVERETRLSKDILRAWEKRYGFPAPQRDGHGERCYPAWQVERLRLMKRLMDHGHRPGQLAALPAEELAALLPRPSPCPAPDLRRKGDAVERLLATVKDNPAGFPRALQQQLTREGLERFVQHIAAPLTAAVGQRWEDGSFEVFNEHFYTEETARVLRKAIAALPGTGASPRVLLTTLPGEPHGLGLLMAEALLALDGAACVSLGTETPLLDIARAAPAFGASVVALSFSAAYPRRQIGAALRQLRLALPAGIAIWAGGASIASQAAIEGVRLLPTLDDGRRALADFRLESKE
jgi:DNA-binding transcriptional MerR regulator/methylmalonyl-CoA mutase cobalamin-binding subunit